MKNINITFLGIIIVLSSQFAILNAQNNDTTRIIILHTNDMHAKIDQMPKLAYYVNYYRNKNNNVFLFSAGDNFTGNPIVDQYNPLGYPMIDLMNKIGFDISCFGNHEFDYGQENVNKYIAQANFPFISSNIVFSKKSVLKEPAPYHKFKCNDGTTIGVFSVIEVNRMGIPDCSPLKVQNLSFANPIKTAKKYISYKDSSDIFIALTHLGFKGDKKLAKKVPVFDAIIGGHSHTLLPNGEIKKGALICQADCYINYLGVLTLKVVKGEIVSKKDSLIQLNDDTKVNPEIAKLVKEYNNNPSLYKTIAYSKNGINGIDELGSMMTDAILDTLDVDIAFQNVGGIRLDSISAGKIIVKQIFELSPFGNTLVEFNLTPKQIKKLIKYTYNFHKKNELQVSGLIINLEVNKKRKLKKISLKTPEGKSLTKDTYKVVVNDYMAAAYGLSFLKNGKEHPIIDAENTIRFIKDKKNIDYTGVKRVFETVLGE